MAKRCEQCGCQMADGSLAYEVRIEVYADFDGVLPAPEAGGRSGGGDRQVVATMAQRDPDALARDVYHSERHLLCPGMPRSVSCQPAECAAPRGGTGIGGRVSRRAAVVAEDDRVAVWGGRGLS